MISLVKDELLGRTVYIAEQRQLRPNDFRRTVDTPSSDVLQSNDAQQAVSSCPFCAGHESETPPQELAICDDAGNWKVRVVPNKFPFLSSDPSLTTFGVHEVVIESPRHLSRSGDLKVGELVYVLSAYQQRLRHWRDDTQLSYPVLFKNVGQMAGASLVHLHSQLAVLPEVPVTVERELNQLLKLRSESGDCEHCHRLREILAVKSQLIGTEAEFVAFCPTASAHTYETWLIPIAHQASFEDLVDLNGLAKLLHETLCRLETVIGTGGYNLILKTAPWRHEFAEHWHWRIEIRPRLGHLAGFEFATERFVNHVAPGAGCR